MSECGNRCATYDWEHNTRHYHCEVPLDDRGALSDLSCNAMVLVEQDGPGSNDFYVEPQFGIRCEICKDVACVYHAVKMSKGVLCSFCANEEMLTFV